MVSRCANPKCSKPFHYLHEGTLFRLMFGYPFRGFHGREHRVRYLWLCAECALKYSPSWDRSRGMVLAPVSGAPEAEEKKLVITINDRPLDLANSA